MAKIRLRPPIGLAFENISKYTRPNGLVSQFTDVDVSEFTAPDSQFVREPNISDLPDASTGKLLRIIRVNDVTDYIDLQFVPREISVKREGSLEEVPIIGRNLPFYQFNSGSECIEFELDFHTELFNNSGADVMKKINWLKALTYLDSFTSSLPRVYLSFGQMFVGEKYVLKTPFEPKLMDFTITKDNNTFFPRRANVTVTFCRDEAVDVKRNDVKTKYLNF